MTLLHLDGVPTSVNAAWIEHSDPGLTLRVYAPSQDGGPVQPSTILGRVKTAFDQRKRLYVCADRA